MTFALVVLLLALDVPASDDDPIRASADAILRDPAFAFCHDERYPLIEDEKGWCEWSAAARPRCPALPKICERPSAALVGPPGRFALRKQGQPERGRGDGPNRRITDREAPPLELPALGGIAMILFWLVLLAAVGVLAHALIAHSRRTPKAPEQPEPPKPDKDDASAAAAIARERERQLETDVDRLLGLARAAAERGAFDEGVDLAHAALLRRLDHEGLIHLHRARTNGEYLRELDDHALHGPVRAVLRDVDRLQFGRESPTRSSFDAIFERIGALARRAGPAVLLAILGGSATSCDPAGMRHPWAVSPSGTEGAMRLLRSQGVAIDYRTESLLAPESDRAIVMLDGADATPEEWAALEPWVLEGNLLVLANGRVPPFLSGLTHDPDSAPLGGPIWVAQALIELVSVESALLPGTPPLVLTAKGQVLLVRHGGTPYAAAIPYGAGEVLVLTSDHLFMNAALAFDDDPVLLVELVRSLGVERIDLIDAWTGSGASTPIDSIRSSKLTAAMMQLLVFVLALFVFRGARFGRARDPRPPHRRAFSQHARVLGLQYGLARADLHAAALYAAWVLERLRDRHPSASMHRLAQAVARRSGRDETDVMRLLVEADTVIEAAARIASGDPSQRTRGRDDDSVRLIALLGALMRETGGSP